MAALPTAIATALLWSASIAPPVSPAAEPDTPQPLMPTSVWVVAGEGGDCGAQRDYRSRDTLLTLLLRTDPFTDTASVVLVAKGGLPLGMGSGSLVLGPARQTVPASYLGDELTDGRKALRVSPHDEEPLTASAIEAATSLTVLAGSTRLAFAIPNSKSAIAALRQCNRLLIRSWGVDPREQDAVRTAARPVVPFGKWFRPADYAPDALMSGAQGETRVLYEVDRSGRLADCRTVVSSGAPALDAAACRALTTRARFSPALDANGRPVPSHGVVRVDWRVDL